MRARMAGGAYSGVRLANLTAFWKCAELLCMRLVRYLLGVTEQSSHDEPSLAAPRRPMRNMERLRRSMRRLMLADFDPGELLQCLQARTLPPTCPHTLCVPAHGASDCLGGVGCVGQQHC